MKICIKKKYIQIFSDLREGSLNSENLDIFSDLREVSMNSENRDGESS